MPKLDLKGKKKEIGYLMEALHLDTKLAITKDRSNREELQAEVVDSLTSWLNDIWSVAYEFHDNYLQAHVCLLFTADVARSLAETPGRSGCKCSLMNMPIDITIKARDGSVVKSFALRGPHGIDRALLWIWREIFVSMLAHGTTSMTRRIPEMFEDIEMTIGWNALERILYGGNSSAFTEYDDFDDDGFYDEDEELHDDNAMDFVDEDGDEDYVDENEHHSHGGTCSFHASHWPVSLEQQRIRLREIVEDILHVRFRTMPSLRMFTVIRAISADPRAADLVLLQETNDNATKSSDTFAGALDIYVSKLNAYRIHVMLSSHSHLLRPRDTEVLQSAVSVLNSGGYSAFGLQILERQLFETIRAIYAAVTSVFGNIDLDEHKLDLEGILKLRAGTLERTDRIRRWSDSVVTQAAPMNPVAFAAMMMAFPMGGPIEEVGPEDPAGFLDDVDESDPDWDDLREEFRPPLKERFDGWIKLAPLWKDASAKTVMSSTYAKAVKLMPFLRGSDIVDEMVTRLNELQGKTHAARAVQSLSTFCIYQRKKISTASKQRRAVADKAAPAPPPSGPSASTSFSFSIPPQPPQPHHLFGGMEDVD
ncbi:hypothetical protein C0991_003590 [Blastosporella zonata]|nr:hypothetical protein C0991_003590 [Blastosporella zonata]